MKNIKVKSYVALLWECVSLVVIALLIRLPERVNLIDKIMEKFQIEQHYCGQLSTASAVVAFLFLVMYILSFEWFKEEKITKMYSFLGPLMMITTIVCLLINA